METPGEEHSYSFKKTGDDSNLKLSALLPFRKTVHLLLKTSFDACSMGTSEMFGHQSQWNKNRQRKDK